MLSNIVRRPSAADTWQLQKHGQSKTNAWTTQVVFARFALQEFREQVSSRALFSLPCRRGQLGCPQITPLTQRLSTSAFKALLPDATGFQLDTGPGGNEPTRATSREGPESQTVGSSSVTPTRTLHDRRFLSAHLLQVPISEAMSLCCM